jgi:hypothetical protein
MIMLGTTPRRLGWANALGAFAVSALLLPLTPSWAQKPADDDEKSVVIELRDTQEAKPETEVKQEIDLVVTSDNSEDKIKADSVKRATEVLKQRIDALVREQGGKEEHAAQIKALKQALGEIQNLKTATFNFKIDSADDKAKAEQRKVIVRRLDGVLDSKFADESKADIAKAKARVDAARKALAEKRNELASAERDLAKLSAKLSHARLDVRFATPPTARVTQKEPDKDNAKVEKHVIARVEKLPPRSLSVRLADPAQQAKVDSKRLDLLEMQLSKLLDEVKSLKQHQDEGRAKGK